MSTSEKRLMKGNEAFAIAAIRSGCRFYFGYPITPQNEIPEYMSRELSKVGGSLIQAERELAAVNKMCIRDRPVGGVPPSQRPDLASRSILSRTRSAIVSRSS